MFTLVAVLRCHAGDLVELQMGASITIDCYANRVNTLAMDTLQTRCTGQPRSSADTDPRFTQALGWLSVELLSACYHCGTYPVYFGMVGLLKKHSELAKSDS